MGGSISIERKGAFVELKDDDGAIKRMHKTGDGIEYESIKRLFFKAEDVACISCKCHETDVMLTLSNGVTYVLDDLGDEQEDAYDQLCEIVMAEG